MVQRLKCINFESLPLTFQDAVKITRDLCIRYLWVDSLCIVQDDPDAWSSESGRMGNIYASSTCTLSAASSPNSFGGCRVNAHNKRTYSARHLDLQFDTQRIRIFEDMPRDWINEYLENPLVTRGWALQEKELSHRNIHFSRNMLLWQCKTFKASTELPWFQTYFDDDTVFKDPGPWRTYNDPSEIGPGSDSLEIRDHWFRLVQAYSRRALTMENDKLPALSGLAKAYNCGDYAAGLWGKHMPSALLWRSKRISSMTTPQMLFETIVPRRPDQYQAPTWSWASVLGRISYQSQRIDEHRDENHSVQDELDFGDFGVLKISMVPFGSDPTGRVLFGSIRVNCCLKPALFTYEPLSSDDVWDDGCRALRTTDGSIVGWVQPDVLLELQRRETIFCVPVRNEQYSCTDGRLFQHRIFSPPPLPEEFQGPDCLVMGLGLVPSDRVQGAFERVGLVRWVKKSYFQGIEASHIEIV